MPLGRTTIQPSELLMALELYERIVDATVYFEENEPDKPIGIGDVCARSKGYVTDVKKVLFYFLYTGRLLPTFRAYCKDCGYLGDRAISVHEISEVCPCCHIKITKIIDFWSTDHRPEFTGRGEG